MALWLVTFAWAGEPAPRPDPALEPQLRSALFVVDAYVVRTVTYDLMGIVWTNDRHPPGTNREVRYCVHWDRPPVGGAEEATVLSEEWVVVDPSGAPLSVERFASLTGLSPHRERSRGAMLGGVQLGFARRDVEAAIAARAIGPVVGPDSPSGAVPGLSARTRDEIRRQVVASMVRPACTEELPAPIRGG